MWSWHWTSDSRGVLRGYRGRRSGVVLACLRRAETKGETCYSEANQNMFFHIHKKVFNSYRTCTRKSGKRWKPPATSCLPTPCPWHTPGTRRIWPAGYVKYECASLLPTLCPRRLSTPGLLWLGHVLPRSTPSPYIGMYTPAENPRHSIIASSVHLLLLLKGPEVQRKSQTLVRRTEVWPFWQIACKWHQPEVGIDRGHTMPHKIDSFPMELCGV